jgi:hypothetical protein
MAALIPCTSQPQRYLAKKSASDCLYARNMSFLGETVKRLVGIIGHDDATLGREQAADAKPASL